MSKSTPAPPDYRAAAEETAAGNKENLEYQTAANRPDQFTPFGNTQWTQDPDTNKWTQRTNLNEDSQRALDAQLKLTGDKSELAGGMYGRLEDDFSEGMDWGQLPEWGATPDKALDTRNRAEENLYTRATSRLDPQWQQREDQTRARLAAQGLRPDDPAYKQAMENMGRERTDAYDRATSSSIMGGGEEATRDFGMDMDRSGYQNKLRNSQMVEEMQKRGMNLNEINAIISGQQVGMPSMPDFNSAGYTGGADYSGAARDKYGADMDAFNADQAMWNSLMTGAGMAGGAMMCDRRLKRHIERIGSFKQYPLYLFQYVWGIWAVGVMADEVNDDAVVVLPNGYAAVDYTRIK